jgi:hypothetical protein
MISTICKQLQKDFMVECVIATVIFVDLRTPRHYIAE